MQKFIKVTGLRQRLAMIRKTGKTIGFTPTMGALHAGHINLVKASIHTCDFSVCSIFVNPTQFNATSDLQKYPRNLARDSQLLKEAGLDILFAPGNRDIYPEDLDTRVDISLNGLDQAFEGAFRPGHFAGVVQVVKRLLDIVQPDKLFMGQKDFQQFTIIRHMIKTLEIPVELVVIPTERESHGLAMSSRNERLSREMRQKAAVLFQTLTHARLMFGKIPADKIRSQAMEGILDAGLKPEYFEIVDGNTLLPVMEPEKHDYVVGLVAAWADDVRLIDNEIFSGGFHIQKA